MAYAPYPHPSKILGCFTEVEFGHRFEYAARDGSFPADFHPELPHMIFVGPLQEARLGQVKKTVADILVDEDVMQKWKIKMHREYSL